VIGYGSECCYDSRLVPKWNFEYEECKHTVTHLRRNKSKSNSSSKKKKSSTDNGA
jgi:hypothetical protein